MAMALLVLAADAAPRSAAERLAFVRENPCPATGLRRGACPNFIVDHIIPLACGGPDHRSNMQWQTVAEAKAKDRWELRGCKRVQGKQE